jgi:hypothetical protein
LTRSLIGGDRCQTGVETCSDLCDLDQPLHVQPLPHRAHPHRGRGGRPEVRGCRR